MEKTNVTNELNEVVEVGTEIAEEVAVEEVAKTVNFKKAGLITLGVGAVVAIAGIAFKKREDIKAWWNRRHEKQEADEFLDEIKDVVDETED